MNTIPTIELVDNRLEGTIMLPIWKDFQNRQIFYHSLDTHETPKGVISLEIGGDMVDDNPIVSVEHVNAYNYLTSYSEQICNSILTNLLLEYKEMQSMYEYDEEEAGEIMPNIETIEEFKNLIELTGIHLLNISKDGFAYVGYSFDCSWDDEHGLGIMTHKDRIIKIGESATSFLTWVAENDLENEQN